MESNTKKCVAKLFDSILSKCVQKLGLLSGVLSL